VRENKKQLGGINMENSNLTVREVAQYLNRSETTIYNMLNQGEIPGIKLGGKWIVRKEDLDSFLDDKMAEQHQQSSM
jgi:excisionase family DNA binding protein